MRRVRGGTRHRERYFGRIRGVLKSSTGNYRRAGFIWSPELDGASLFREGATDKMASVTFGMAVSFTAKAAWDAGRGGDKTAKACSSAIVLQAGTRQQSNTKVDESTEHVPPPFLSSLLRASSSSFSFAWVRCAWCSTRLRTCRSSLKSLFRNCRRTRAATILRQPNARFLPRPPLRRPRRRRPRSSRLQPHPPLRGRLLRPRQNVCATATWPASTSCPRKRTSARTVASPSTRSPC